MYTINLRKADFTKRALVLAFRPFFDATKTESVVAAVDHGKIIWFHIAHTNTTVFIHRCGFLITVIVIFI